MTDTTRIVQSDPGLRPKPAKSPDNRQIAQDFTNSRCQGQPPAPNASRTGQLQGRFHPGWPAITGTPNAAREGCGRAVNFLQSSLYGPLYGITVGDAAQYLACRFSAVPEIHSQSASLPLSQCLAPTAPTRGRIHGVPVIKRRTRQVALIVHR